MHRRPVFAGYIDENIERELLKVLEEVELPLISKERGITGYSRRPFTVEITMREHGFLRLSCVPSPANVATRLASA